jgi:hypothetical protein
VAASAAAVVAASAAAVVAASAVAAAVAIAIVAIVGTKHATFQRNGFRGTELLRGFVLFVLFEFRSQETRNRRAKRRLAEMRNSEFAEPRLAIHPLGDPDGTVQTSASRSQRR